MEKIRQNGREKNCIFLTKSLGQLKSEFGPDVSKSNVRRSITRSGNLKPASMLAQSHKEARRKLSRHTLHFWGWLYSYESKCLDAYLTKWRAIFLVITDIDLHEILT